MKRQQLIYGALAAALLTGTTGLARAAELDGNALLNADQNPNDWPMYHGTYKSWHYSALDQINSTNIKQLQLAWMHNPGSSPHGGIQSFPLAIDGVVYYTTAMDQIWAVNGATGAFLWSFKPQIDEDWANTITTVYNRGLAAAYGNLYVGTVDGRLLAVDMKSGKQVWETKLIDVAKGIKGIHRGAARREGQGDHRLHRRRAVRLLRTDFRG